MSDVLLLNANGSPVNWLPLSVTSWQNAMRLMWLDVIDVLHVYEDWVVHSPSLEVEVPSVIILKEQVKGFRNWKSNDACPQAHLVFLRDLFLCQYCGKKFSRRDLTIDHVTPRYYGGQTSYENVTTACSPCNGKRGHDMRIRPMTAPFLPTMGQLLKNMRKFPIQVPHQSWVEYLGWDTDLVQLKPRHSSASMNEDFDIRDDHDINFTNYDFRP